MDFLKKYPLLCTVITVLLAAFVVQLVFVYMEMGKTDKARSAFLQTERQLKSLLQPADQKAMALSSANLDKIKVAVAESRAMVANVVRGLSGDQSKVSSEQPPANGRDLLFNLQGFVDEMNREASKEADIVNPENGLTETKPQVEVPADFSFGFGKYMGSDVQPPPDSAVSGIFRQRQILEYLVRTLFNARPKNQPLKLVSVEREIVKGETVTVEKEQQASRQTSRRDARGKTATRSNDLFEVNPLVSARVNGAIEAIAFRLKFIGYTDTLRNFINTLAKFELPLVVRSVEVQAATKSAAATSRKRTSQSAAIAALFGTGTTSGAATGGDAAASAQGKPFVAKAPVVTDNLSEFTVVVEFVSIIDPEKAKAKPVPAPATASK